MQPLLTDSHCHLNSDFGSETEMTVSQLIERAKAQGVENFITVGCDLETSLECQNISTQFQTVWHTIGFHPHEASRFNKNNSLDELKKLSLHPKCLAIGEIGLDYYYKHSTPADQKDCLESQLELALELKRPVVIHARDAEKDLIQSLKSYSKKSSLKHPGAIHCFTGTEQFGKTCLDLGFLISFSGIITFKKADDLRHCVKEFPLNQLMVETDSPYLAPVPFRGKKCEPAMVRLTALKVAEIKNISLDEVALHTTLNAKRFFNISQ